MRQRNNIQVCAIVVLYNPSAKDLTNIHDYMTSVNKLYVLDNSESSHEKDVCKIVERQETGRGKIRNNISEIPEIEFRHFQINVGLCRALNYGMLRAAEDGFTWALLMDQDSSFMTNVIDAYECFLNSNRKEEIENIGVLAPVHIYDRSLRKSYDGHRYVKWAMTSGCLYNVSVFSKFGGFKEELFVDGLDMDYCYRIRSGGGRVVELSAAKISHIPAETRIKNIAGIKLRYGVSSPWRYGMQARALVWQMLAYKSFFAVLMYFVKFTKILLLFENKKKYLREWKKGSKEGLQLWRNS